MEAGKVDVLIDAIAASQTECWQHAAQIMLYD